ALRPCRLTHENKVGRRRDMAWVVASSFLARGLKGDRAALPLVGVSAPTSSPTSKRRFVSNGGERVQRGKSEVSGVKSAFCERQRTTTKYLGSETSSVPSYREPRRGAECKDCRLRP